MKRVFIVHGWGGNPKECWFPWLKKELEKRGYGVFVPQLPDTDNPRIYNWVTALSKVVGVSNKNTYFIGHSMGCQTIARYVESLPESQKVGGAVFVGGFFKHLSGLEDEPGILETEKHWLSAPVNFTKIKSRLKKSVAIFSDNDPYVPLDNQDDFKNKLGSKIIIEHNKGHLDDEANIKELPSALQAVLDFGSQLNTKR